MKKQKSIQADIEVLKCPDCNGNGWTAEHDPSDPHLSGECSGSCPVQVQCERCIGTGKIRCIDILKEELNQADYRLARCEPEIKEYAQNVVYAIPRVHQNKVLYHNYMPRVLYL